MRNSAKAVVTALLFAGLTNPATAQTYPERQIKLVVPFAAGGVTDVVGRMTAEYLGNKLGQRLVVENVAGAGGNSGVANVIKAGADGHTLALVPTGNLAINPHIFASMPFDPLKDLVTIGIFAHSPQIVVITPSVPAKDLKSFIAYAKANPGKINYGSAGLGSTNHLAADQFAKLAGIEMVHVAYRGAAPAVTDLVGQHVQFMSIAVAPVIEHVAAGKLTFLGAATAQRMSTLQDYPTVAEAGLPGYESTTWFGIVAPTGTPVPIVARLNGYLREMVGDAEMLGRFKAAYLEPMNLSLDDCAKLVREDHAKWGAIVRNAGVKPQ